MHARVERSYRAQIGAIPQTHAMVRPGGDDEGRRGEGESVDTTAQLGHVHARRWQHRAACETEHRKRADGPSQQFAFRICREENRRVGIGGGGGGGGGIGGIGGGGVGVGGSGGGISFCVRSADAGTAEHAPRVAHERHDGAEPHEVPNAYRSVGGGGD
jgi:hypothetical protein